VDETPSLVSVPRILRRHPRHAARLRELDQLRRQRGLVSARMMELDFDRETIVVEDLAPPVETITGIASRANQRRHLTRRRTGERVQSLRMRDDMRPR